MSETQQEGAPAVASDDPANLAGPGVTPNPPDSGAVFDLAAVAEENARLRSELIAENDRLKAALADSRLAGAELQGLSDEDVRKLEHPEEYAAEYASLGEHESLKAQLASLRSQFASVQSAQQAAAPVETVALTSDLASLSDDELAAELARRRQAQ